MADFIESRDPNEIFDEIQTSTVPIRIKILWKKQHINSEINTSARTENRKRSVRFKRKLKNFLKSVSLWRGSFKIFENQFDRGVMFYFKFVRFLMLLNLTLALIILSFIIIPWIFLKSENYCPTSEDCCSAQYYNSTDQEFHFIDILQGSGPLASSFLFYGGYLTENSSYDFKSAYLSTTIGVFLVSLAIVVRSGTKSFKENVITKGKNDFHNYCVLIYSGWSFSIDSEKQSLKRHRNVYKDLVNKLEEKNVEAARLNKLSNEKTKIIAIRVLVNVVVLIMLVGSAAAVYYTYYFSAEELKKDNTVILALIFEYLPSLSIVLLNLAVPVVFDFLISFEFYKQSIVLNVNLIRMISLRLFSLCVLYVNLYEVASCEKGNECFGECQPCWETYTGQQIYKLIITDLATQILITFVLNFIRSRIGKLDNAFAKFIGEQTFYLPTHVLDVIYLQTISWFGIFFLPLNPTIYTIIFFITFYIKKFACLVNSNPNSSYKIYNSHSLYVNILLISFAFAVIPYVIIFFELVPSKSCGSFRDFEYFWGGIVDAIATLSQTAQDFLFYLSTIGFTLPLFIILVLFTYYEVSVLSTNKKITKMLKAQVKHEKEYKSNIVRQTYLE